MTFFCLSVLLQEDLRASYPCHVEQPSVFIMNAFAKSTDKRLNSAPQLSSVTFQLLLHVTSAYFVFYFLVTLGVIIRKSERPTGVALTGFVPALCERVLLSSSGLELPYPADALACDVTLLLLLAALGVLHYFFGERATQVHKHMSLQTWCQDEVCLFSPRYFDKKPQLAQFHITVFQFIPVMFEVVLERSLITA